jgi:hypothetical protein
LLKAKIGSQVENKYSLLHIAKAKTRKLIAVFLPGVYWHFDTQCSRFIENSGGGNGEMKGIRQNRDNDPEAATDLTKER